MKKIIITILFFIIILLRLNLPSKNISNNLLLKSNTSITGEVIAKIIYSDTIADWQYRDYILVRYACSERMELSLIAIPFGKWGVYKKGVTSCD